MSTQETLTINIAVQGAAQAAEQIGNVNTQLGATQGAANNAASGVNNAGNAAGTAAQKHAALKANLIAIAGGFTSAMGGALSLYGAYQSLEMATLGVQRADTLAEAAHTRVMKAQDAYNKAVEKFGPNSRQAIEAGRALATAKEKEGEAVDKARLKHEELNTAYANFIQQLGPSLMSIGGSVVTMFSGLTGKAGGAAAAAEGFGKAMGGASIGGRSMLGVLGPIGLAIGAGLLLYEALKNNWFGITDAFTAAGKAIGDALPFLRPVLILIQDIGGALGIGGANAGKWKDDLGRAFNAVKDQLTGIWGAFVDAGTKMKDAFQNAMDKIRAGDWKGAFNVIGSAVYDLFYKYVQPTADKISPAFGHAFQELTQGNILKAVGDLGLGIQDMYYKYAAPALNKIDPAFTTAFQKLTKGDIVGAVTNLGLAFGTLWDKYVGPALATLGANILKYFQTNAPIWWRQVANAAAATFQFLADNIPKWLSAAGAAALTAATGLGNIIYNAIVGGIKIFAAWFSKFISDSIHSAAAAVIAAASSIGSGITKAIISGLGNISAQFNKILVGMANDVGPNIVKAFEGVGKGIWDTIMGGLKSGAKQLYGGRDIFAPAAQAAAQSAAPSSGAATAQVGKAVSAAAAPAGGAGGAGSQYGPFAVLVTQTNATVVAIVQLFTKMVRDINGIWTLITTGIQTFVTTAFVNSLQKGSQNMNVIVDANFKAMQIAIQAVLNAVVGLIQPFVTTAFVNSLEKGAQNMNVIVDANFKAMEVAIKASTGAMTANIQSFVRTAFINSLELGATNAQRVIATAFNAMVTSVRNSTNQMIVMIGNLVNAIRSVPTTWTTNFLGNVSVLSSAVSQAKNLIASVPTSHSTVLFITEIRRVQIQPVPAPAPFASPSAGTTTYYGGGGGGGGGYDIGARLDRIIVLLTQIAGKDQIITMDGKEVGRLVRRHIFENVGAYT